MKVLAKDNGMFVLRGSVNPTKISEKFDMDLLKVAASEDGNFIAKLSLSERLMSESMFEAACQLRLDASLELLEAIENEDEMEFDLSDKNTFSAIKIMALSSIDHYLICDFDTAISLAETVLEFSPEYGDEIMLPLAFSYAMLGDKSAVTDVMPFINISENEKELLVAISDFINHKQISLSDSLKSQLKNPETDLSLKTAHLWLSLPDFKQMYI